MKKNKIKIILTIVFILFINISVVFFLNSCGSCGSDPADSTQDGNDVGNDSVKTAIIEGSLAISEIEKTTLFTDPSLELIPPSTPLPEDITIVSILTRSDLTPNAEYVLKYDLEQTTSATLGNDEKFSLEVPVGYEFITFVKMNDDVLGLIKFKKDDKYVANITVTLDDTIFLKGIKKESSFTKNIGPLSWYGDYFKAESTPSGIESNSSNKNPISIDGKVVENGEAITIDMYAGDDATLTFTAEEGVYLANVPAFCSTEENNNTLSLICSASSGDAGTYLGMFASSKDSVIEIKIKVKSCNMSVSAGSYHTCAILKNCSVKCWGSNDYGQLGYGDIEARGDESAEMGENLPFVDLGKDRKALSICTGHNITCTLLDNNTVKCWGYNEYNGFGGLGLGDRNNRGDNPNEMGDNLPPLSLGTNKSAIALSCGGAFDGCAILNDNSVKCWGAPAGLGEYIMIGDDASDMGDNLQAIDLGTGRSALSITVSDSTACAILDDSSIKCWGNNNVGQLGLGDTSDRGYTAGQMGDSLRTIDIGSKENVSSVSSIYASGRKICIISDIGLLKCWGDNSVGQLGLGDTVNRGDGPNEMGDLLPFVNLGSEKTVLSITGSEIHSCALLSGGIVKCWGMAGDVLGLGDLQFNQQIGDEPNEMGDILTSVSLGTGRTGKAISSSSFNHTCVILDNDKIKCWGTNSSGQLGYGDTESRGYDISEMGDNLPYVDLGENLNISIDE